MSKYTIEIQPGLSQIPPNEWNAVVQRANGSIFYSYEWLRAYTRAAPHQSEPYHILAYDDAELAAVLPVFLTESCPRLLAHRKYLVTREPDLREPMLLAHSLYSYYGGPLYGKNDTDLLVEMMTAFEQLAHDLPVEVYGLVNFAQENKFLWQHFRNQEYIARYLSSAMYLPIVWTSFDDYLMYFRSKRRRNIRGAARKANKAGVFAEFVSQVPDMDEIVFLIERILIRHGHIDTNLYPRHYLEAISEEMEEAAKYLLVYSPHGQLICFFLVLDDGKCLTPWVAGIDYEMLKRYEPYHFAYRWLIDYAIKHNYRHIDFGRSSYRFKRRYGCKRRTLSLVLNTTRPDLRPEVDRWSQELATFESRTDEHLQEQTR